MGNDRFDKFTERARNAVTLAKEEATRFNHNYIGTEHLLLGLLREGEGIAAKVLTSMGVELKRVRSAVEFIIGRGDRMIVGEIGLTPRAKKVIELAVDEARRLGHHYIGTEHLLLGLVREGEGIAAGVLESLGVNLEKVRTQTVLVLDQGFTDASDPRTPQPLVVASAFPSRPLTDDAREVLMLAKEYAQELRAAVIEPEHILLGLTDAKSETARAMLDAMGVDIPVLKGRLVGSPGQRQADLIDAWLSGKTAEADAPSGLSPAARRIVEHSVEEADRLADDRTDSVHLLLGILHTVESAPSQYLAEYNVTLDSACAFLLEQRERERAEAAARIAEAAVREEKERVEATARRAAAAQASGRGIADIIGQAILMFPDDLTDQERAAAAAKMVDAAQVGARQMGDAVVQVVEELLGDMGDQVQAEATTKIRAAVQAVGNAVAQAVEEFQVRGSMGEQERAEAALNIGVAFQSMGVTIAQVTHGFHRLGEKEQEKAWAKIGAAGSVMGSALRQAVQEVRGMKAKRRPGFFNRFFS